MYSKDRRASGGYSTKGNMKAEGFNQESLESKRLIGYNHPIAIFKKNHDAKHPRELGHKCSTINGVYGVLLPENAPGAFEVEIRISI